MGQCLSASDTISLTDIVNRPGTTEPQLDAKTIKKGLETVAARLKAKKLNISIVAVGGAVNTLLLRTRPSTSDVDFFYRTKTKHEDVSKLIIAAEQAREALKLDEHWLNNHTAVFIEEGTIQKLYDEAIKQNDVVFTAAGLTVYAAPWRYAFMTKLDRLAKSGARLYDMTDAVDYLEHFIKKQGGKPVKKSEVKNWAGEFKLTASSEDLLNRVEAEYKKKTGKDGIVNG